MFIQKPLPYAFDSLEPYIDTKTMQIHYQKHHAAYTEKLNLTLEDYKELKDKSIVNLLTDIHIIPDEIKISVINNGGGFYNHNVYWETMGKKNILKKSELYNALVKAFGSIDTFMELFEKAALTQFGSGWAWLVIDKNKLEILQTANQDSPLSQLKIPIMNLDVWEHAYYLHYQNKRDEYVKNWWNVVNWEGVENNYKKAIAT